MTAVPAAARILAARMAQSAGGGRATAVTTAAQRAAAARTGTAVPDHQILGLLGVADQPGQQIAAVPAGQPARDELGQAADGSCVAMIAVVPSMIRLSSATSRRTPSEPDYFEDLAGDALVDTRPAERDVLQDGRGQNGRVLGNPPRRAAGRLASPPTTATGAQQARQAP